MMHLETADEEIELQMLNVEVKLVALPKVII